MFRFISAFMTLLILVLEIFDIINRYSHYNNILEKKVSFSAKQKFKAARNSWWHKETERAEIDFDSEFTLDFSHLGTEQPDPVMSTFHFQVIVNELRDRKPGESVPWSEQLSCYIADEYCQQPVLVNNHQLTHEWHNTIPPVLLSLDNFQKRLIKMARKKFKPLNQDLASSLETSSTIAIETLFKKIHEEKSVYASHFEKSKNKDEHTDKEEDQISLQSLKDLFKSKRDPNIVLSALAASIEAKVTPEIQSFEKQNKTHRPINQ